MPTDRGRLFFNAPLSFIEKYVTIWREVLELERFESRALVSVLHGIPRAVFRAFAPPPDAVRVDPLRSPVIDQRSSRAGSARTEPPGTVGGGWNP